MVEGKTVWYAILQNRGEIALSEERESYRASIGLLCNSKYSTWSEV
jgi:hypothetical protein